MAKDNKFVGANIPIEVKAEITRQKELTGKSQQEIVKEALIAHLVEDGASRVPTVDEEKLRQIIDEGVAKIELPDPAGVGETEVQCIVNDILTVESNILRQDMGDNIEELEAKLVKLRERIEDLERLTERPEEIEPVLDIFEEAEQEPEEEQQPFEQLPEEVFDRLNSIIVRAYKFEEDIYQSVEEEKLFRVVADDLEEFVEPTFLVESMYWDVVNPSTSDLIDGAISNVVEVAQDGWDPEDYFTALSEEFEELEEAVDDQKTGIHVELDAPVMQMVEEAIEKVNVQGDVQLVDIEHFVEYVIGQKLKDLGEGGLFVMGDKAMKKIGKEVIAKFKN